MERPHALVEFFITVFVVPHGVTDLWMPDVLKTTAIYTLCFGLSFICKKKCLKPLFLLTSVIHFSEDCNFALAALFVCLLGSFHLNGRDSVAFALLSLYMATVHLPLHFFRVAPLLNTTFVPIYTTASALCLRLRHHMDYFSRSDGAVRILVAAVAAHTITNKSWSFVDQQLDFFQQEI